MEVMVICDELGQAVSAKGGIPRINSVIFRVKQSVVEIQSLEDSISVRKRSEQNESKSAWSFKNFSEVAGLPDEKSLEE